MKTNIPTKTVLPENYPISRRHFIVATALTTMLPLAGCTDSSDSGVAEASEPEEVPEDEESSEEEPQDSTEEEDSGPVTDREADESFVVSEYDWGQQSYGSVYMYGKAENTSDNEISWATVTVYLYDEDGTRIDEGLAGFSDVRPGEVVNFECTFFEVESEDEFTDYEIVTEASAW